MANFRSNSCPVDPWVHESGTPPEDRAKSALGGKEQNESKRILNNEVSVKPRYFFLPIILYWNSHLRRSTLRKFRYNMLLSVSQPRFHSTIPFSSENTDLNIAKVNQWVDLKSEVSEKFNTLF